jgi:hypothetical protein
MNIKQTLKTFVFTLAVIFTANSCFAAVLEIDYKDEEITLTTKESIKSTVFKRFNDLWVVFSDKQLAVTFDYSKLSAFGMTQVEKLTMKNSKGYRFRFVKEVPDVVFVNDYENRTVGIKLVKAHSKVNRTDTVKFRVDNDVRDEKVKNLYLDSAFMLDYAYSMQTGEKYLIAVGSDKRLRYPTKQVLKDLYFLPTYAGAAMISENGEFLTIVEEDQVKLTDKEDPFFDQAIATNLESGIENFLKDSGVNLLEKQLRDYSSFDRAVDRFKSDGDYEDAVGRLDSALDLIAGFNYMTTAKELMPVTTTRLDNVMIQEGGVLDMSSKDDGLFEISKQAEKELNKEVEDEKDVLVPDFSDDNISFLMEKLRLSVIKQPGGFKKEKINIKRMQISAFKGYYPEILDLAKLVRTDISGEFPRTNKALALFTLAKAKMNRCDDVIPLPEKAGSVYTKDIKLWKAYCLVEQKKFDVAASLFENDFPRIETYPKHLKDDLMLAYAKALRGVDNYGKSIKVLKDLTEGETEKFIDEVNYNLALSYLYNNENELAFDTFKSVVFSENLPIRYQARYEYLNMLLQKQDFSKKDIISALEDLRFDFRGGDIELNYSKTLASIYLQEDYLKQAMELYKYISIYFAGTNDAKQATETLFNVFYNLFAKKQQTNSTLDEISRLALFYDFIELTPSEYEGNEIITNIVNDLVALELYDDAIKLLTIQLNYKTKDEDLAQELGEKLADLYLKTGQLKNALKTLILTQKNADEMQYTDFAKITKAKTLLKFEKVEQAEKLLKSIKDSLQAKYILADIYWNQNDNDKIIDTLENIFLGKKAQLDEDAMIRLSYLMVAYSLNKDVEKLKQIKNLYLSELAKVDLANKLEFLLKLAGEDVKIEQQDADLLDTWQKVIDIDNKVAEFISQYDTEADFREALIARDYETLVDKYANRLE